MTEHEYAILGGFSRAKVGRLIGSVAAGISSLCVFLLLTVVDIARQLGMAANVPPIAFSLLGAAAIWAVLYLLFNRFVWRWKWVSRALRAPDIRGVYAVVGETLNSKGQVLHNWQGEMNISQSWDRIRVRLKTPASTSYSVTATLFFDPTDGYRLLYHYKNEPASGLPKLTSHRGFADILFNENLSAAEGEYFNGQGRFTFGRLSLSRTLD